MHHRGRLPHVPHLADVQVRAIEVRICGPRLTAGHPGEPRTLSTTGPHHDTGWRTTLPRRTAGRGHRTGGLVPRQSGSRRGGARRGRPFVPWHGRSVPGPDAPSRGRCRRPWPNRSQERPAVHHDTDGAAPAPAGDSTIAVIGSSSSRARASGGRSTDPGTGGCMPDRRHSRRN